MLFLKLIGMSLFITTIVLFSLYCGAIIGKMIMRNIIDNG